MKFLTKTMLFIPLLSIAFFPLAIADEKISIFKIFDQFVLASAAAGKCEKPNKETLGNFLANFKIVWVVTSEELQKKYPDWPNEKIGMAMKKRSDYLTEKVYETLKKESCDSPKITDLLKRFHMQAKLDFRISK